MNTLTRLRKSLRAALLILLVAIGGVALPNQSQAPKRETERGDLPRLENAKVEKRNVTGTLAATVADVHRNATTPVWIGYAVDPISGEHTICCGNYSDPNGNAWCGKCTLEMEDGHWNGTRSGHGSIAIDKDGDSGATHGIMKLEGAQRLVVLFRLQEKQLTRIKLASEDCVLDAGGLPFFWLTDVKPTESVAFLGSYVHEREGVGSQKHSTGNDALTAIALHDGQEAEAALESFTAPAQPEGVEKTGGVLAWSSARETRSGSIAAHGEKRSFK
jgi:hypothetical protein